MSSIIREISSFYQNYCSYMEKETIGVEIGVYAVSGLIFSAAYLKIRPVTKLVKPAKIPLHFIKEGIPQKGIIARIEPASCGPIICINHKPLLNIFFTSRRTLPVKLSGVEINSNGYSWLQTITVDKPVKFVALAKNNDYAECQVFMLSESKDRPNIDLANALISLGFGKAIPSHAAVVTESKTLSRYFKNLTVAEKKARSNRNGMWLATIPPPIWAKRMIDKIFHNLVFAIIPERNRLPQLVR